MMGITVCIVLLAALTAGSDTIVAIAASIVVLLVSRTYDRFGARMTAAVSLGVLVGTEARGGGRSVKQAVAYAAVALVIAASIAYVKLIVSG
jgi:hypothetical protein